MKKAVLVKILLDWLERYAADLHFVVAGHRVVHGGTFFSKPVIVNAEVDARLRQLVQLALLHQPHNLTAIRALKQLQPEWVQVACFDTAFHHTMAVRNDLDRFHLVADVIDRVPKLGYLAAYTKQPMRDKLIEHRQYINRYGEDMPEIRDWKWGVK